MSLKADRIELLTDVSFFATATATRGGVASRTAPGGSGVSMDDASAVVSYAATASGALPMGILLNDVVDLDLTRQHINWHKDEVQKGGKVTLLRIGQVTTNSLVGSIVPGPGSGAYVGANGLIGTSAASGCVQIGTFLSNKDDYCYAKVSINIL